MKRFCARLAINFMALELWGLALVVLMSLNPGGFHTFRNLQRAVEPADQVFVSFYDRADGRRQVDCSSLPGAPRSTVDSKLRLAQTLLLLGPGDGLLEHTTPPRAAQSDEEKWFFVGLSFLLFASLLLANPVGRLLGSWRTRQRRSSQVKLALGCATLLTPVLMLLPGALSNLWLNARVVAVAGPSQQTFRVWRHDRQGIVVLAAQPTAALHGRLVKALKLSPQDRLDVQAAPPSPDRLAVWPLLLGVLLYAGLARLCWGRMAPARKQKYRQLLARLGWGLRSALVDDGAGLTPRCERICRHRLFLWH